MQPFEVDTGDELLPSGPRRSTDDVWWQVSEKHQQAKDRTRKWLIAATAIAAAGLITAFVALGTAGVATRRSSASINDETSTGSSSSSKDSRSPGWGHIRRIAFSSCTSYDVRPQPIWTQASLSSAEPASCWRNALFLQDQPLVLVLLWCKKPIRCLFHTNSSAPSNFLTSQQLCP